MNKYKPINITLIGPLTLLGAILTCAKIMGAISWPWIWVLSPFWIQVAFPLALFAVIGAVAAICLLVGSIFDARSK
jgi:hypothetical protein